MESFLLQKSVKENAEEMQQFLHGMIDWEKEMKRKEKALKEESTKNTEPDLNPIRTKISKTEDSDQNTSVPAEKRKREESLFEKELGNELVQQKKWEDAIFHYTQAINAYSKDATFYTNRALCFLKTKKWREAETDCTIALQIDPEYVKAYLRRSSALKELNQLQEAHTDLLQALKVDPKNTLLKSEASKIEKLLFEQNAINIPKDNKEGKKMEAYLKKEKGNTFVATKKWKAAIECYTEACKLYPEDVSFYLNRALCYLKTSEYEKTVLDCIRVLETEPENVKALYRKAVANRLIGATSLAHDDLLKASQLDPSNKAVQLELLKLEANLGAVAEKPAKKEPQPNVNNKEVKEVPKRITGERFLKLGGKLVNPVKKSANQLSKKPMKRIEIIDKSETDLLKGALDEINLSGADELETVEKFESPPLEVEAAAAAATGDDSRNDAPLDVDSLPCPKSLMQFVNAWNNLAPISELQYKYLKKINGDGLPTIFKDALESYMFSEILQVLSTECVRANESVYHYLNGLRNVKRFSALILFASDEDKENIKLLIDHCEKRKEVSVEELTELKSRYHC